MPIADLDRVASTYMPLDDVTTCGGAKLATGEILASALDNVSWWWLKSDGADIRQVIVRGRTQSGEYRSEIIDLSGTEAVITNYQYSRITALEVAADGTRVVTMGRVFRTGIESDVLYTLAATKTYYTVLFKQSYPVEYTEQVRYEKVFFVNNTGLLVTQLFFTIESAKNPGGYINVGVDPVIDDTLDTENRTVVPVGVTFRDPDDPGSVTTLAAGEATGVWFRQTLPALTKISRANAIMTLSVAAEVNAVPKTGDYEALVEPAIFMFARELPFSLES